MPTYREALEKLMNDPKKAAAWKKKHGDLSLSNFTKVSKEFNKNKTKKPVKSVSNIKPASTTTGKIIKASLNQSAAKASDELRNKGEGVVNIAEKPSDRNIKKAKGNAKRVAKILARKKQSEVRKNRRADRLAARKGFKGAGQYDDNDALMAARKEARELMTARAGRRKQFLRDFASQLARGEQAGKPSTEYKGNYKEGDNFGQKGGSKEDVAETAQTEENIAQNKEKLNTSSNNNSSMNTFLGTTNFAKEFNVGAEFDTKIPDLTKTSLLAKIEEDSTPQKAMVKMYNAKRGR